MNDNSKFSRRKKALLEMQKLQIEQGIHFWQGYKKA